MCLFVYQEKQNEANYLREHRGELIEELAKTIVQKVPTNNTLCCLKTLTVHSNRCFIVCNYVHVLCIKKHCVLLKCKSAWGSQQLFCSRMMRSNVYLLHILKETRYQIALKHENKLMFVFCVGSEPFAVLIVSLSLSDY